MSLTHHTSIMEKLMERLKSFEDVVGIEMEYFEFGYFESELSEDERMKIGKLNDKIRELHDEILKVLFSS